MSARTIFHPKGWLTLFAILHTLMFLAPQLFATATVVDMNWGEGQAPEFALFYEQMMGTLGIGYTPMLLGIAFLTEGTTRARLTLVTAIGMGLTAAANTGLIMAQPGYLDDMVAFLIGMPVVIFGGTFVAGLLHLNDGDAS